MVFPCEEDDEDGAVFETRREVSLMKSGCSPINTRASSYQKGSKLNIVG
jgi:hypothetical protein